MMHYTTEDFIDYIHGELAPSEDARLYAHLATCTGCHAAFAQELALSEALKGSAIAEERELPPMLKAQIWAKIRMEQPTLMSTLRGYLRPAYALPVAAALLVAGFFGVPAARSGFTAAAQPGVAASYYLDEHAAEAQANPLADRTLRVNNADERSSSTPMVINSATISVTSATN